MPAFTKIKKKHIAKGACIVQQYLTYNLPFLRANHSFHFLPHIFLALSYLLLQNL